MNEILEYIMTNYTWFLSGAIIILLAIIGSYAEKTNFGQGRKQDENKPNDDEAKIDLNNVRLNDLQNQNIGDDDNNVSKELDSIVESSSDDVNKIMLSDEERQEAFDKSFEKFDEEFDEILPKKEIINGDLLSEIDDLSLDKTQKLDFNDIPDLDDVDLPEIKKLQPEEEDVWKF